MAVTITNDSRDVLLKEEQLEMGPKLNSSTIIEENHSMRYAFGEADMSGLYFDGYHMAFGKAEVYENLHIEHVSRQPLVGMLFLHRGDICARIEGLSNSFRFSTAEHNLMFSPQEHESADVAKQQGISIFTLSFTQERFLQLAENNGEILEKLANRIVDNKSVMLDVKKNRMITPRMNMVIEDIRRCGFQGGLKKLFLQSKATELLALQCDQVAMEKTTRMATRKITGSDVERLHHARTLLLKDLQNPPSLAQLARLSGLNEFKLKTGFREVFHNTVFGCLSDHRLELARDLIQSGTKTMTMIADEAGYSSVQHFSNAFRKKYGISPSKI
ncbi:helix-turn-helix transcriptional regulator [Chitinophaga vietnamensis]|uniref:helix-turn-helix transcriptional regulator n=1 Tax=Chitinophaga vietnamensis TaxID=2593957 RepID=UPI001375E066|nr:AraC family transcriptional regulator [Chitinophaga vietnamensis]